MVYFVYAIIVISFLDNFSQLPIISLYARDLGGGPFLIGLIIGMYSISNMIGNVVAGPWIDRIGRKKIMAKMSYSCGSSKSYWDKIC